MIVFWILIRITTVSAEVWHNDARTFKSYFLSKSASNSWSSALVACENRHSKLAVITSEQQNDFIRGLTKTNLGRYWIGMIRGDDSCGCSSGNNACYNCRNSWKWIDNTPMGYDKWNSNKPDSNEDCGHIKTDSKKWTSAACSSSDRLFICQHDCRPRRCKRTECEYRDDSYICECMPGYAGDHCDTEINECDSQPCLNDGNCQDKENGFTCICKGDFMGTNCEIVKDKCDSNPCFNDATCGSNATGHWCTCPQGYTGRYCETDIDYCLSDPCVNNGTCVDEIDGFTCQCVANNTGNNCEDMSGGKKSTSKVDDEDQGVRTAFNIGISLFAVSFVIMVVIIIIYIKTTPQKDEEEENNATNEESTEHAQETTSFTNMECISTA